MRSVAGVAALARAVAVAGSRIARAAKAAEDLSPDRIVPIAEGGARHVGRGGPRAAPQHLVVRPEEQLGVFRIRKRLVPRVASEVGGGPFPHVADHSVAPDG